MTNNLVARFTQTVKPFWQLPSSFVINHHWMSTALPPHVAKEVKENSVVEEKHSPLT